MSLLDWLTEWIDKDQEQLAYLPIDPSQTDRQETTGPLEAGVHYIRLRLSSMFLSKHTAWFKTWYPAVNSIVRFNFGDKTIEVPNIADASRLLAQQTSQGDVIAKNFVLTPTVPFNGGMVTLTAGLFAVQGQNNLALLLKTLGNFSNLLNVSQLSLALTVVEPLTLGLQDLLASPGSNLHLGLHDSFSAGELKPGYLAVIRAPRNSIEPGTLYVRNGELYSGQSLTSSAPFESADHMLFRVELFDRRDDWESLTAIQQPFHEALTALPDESRSAHHMRTALLRATLSPDLTSVDKRRVVDRLVEQYEDAKLTMNFKGAVEEAPPTLRQVMRASMSVKAALGKGTPTIDEVLGAIRQTATPMGVGSGGFFDPTVKTRFKEWSTSAPPAVEKSFYFATSGKDVHLNRVRPGAEFDLTFNYGVPVASTVARTSGKELDDLLRVDRAELDILIIPRGFTITDGKWTGRAIFINGVLEKEVVFHLKAADQPVPDPAVYVIFERNGAVLYEFSIPFQVTASIETTPAAESSGIDFNLDELDAAKDRKQRTARLLIFANGDDLSITFDNLETDQSFQVEPKKLTRTTLVDLLLEIKEFIDPVPNHAIWNTLNDTLAKPAPGSSGERAFKECMEGVATAGWILFKRLAEDADVKPILEAIEAMPHGSTLSIRTDCAFLPWEILNSTNFSIKYSEAIRQQTPAQPQNFWGNRFLIECLLAGRDQTYKTPLALHQASPSFVSLNIFSTIDKDFEGKKFLPGQSHEALLAELKPGVGGEVRKTGSTIRSVFDTKDYEATMIYLFCHGQNDKALHENQREKLEIDKDDFVAPDDIYVPNTYPRGPIVFLNSCSSGSFSALSFSTFLKQFRAKQALGLIATNFPVPITFGSAFGQELMRRYLKNKRPIGEALLELRREQLANGNPLGLFYALQCPLDVAALTN